MANDQEGHGQGKSQEHQEVVFSSIFIFSIFIRVYDIHV